MNNGDKSSRVRTLMIFTGGLALGALSGWHFTRQAGEAPDAAAARNGKGAAQGAEISGAGSTTSRSDKTGSASRPAAAAESEQFADSVRSIFRENMEERRMAMFESLLERASPEHYAVVVSLIRENDLRGTGSAGEWSRLWASWGRRDPTGAIEFIKKQDWSGWSREAPTEAKNRTLTYWAQTDPDAAKRFVEEASALDGDRSGVYGLVRGWAAADAEAAAQWIFKSGLGMSAEYKAVVEAISRKGGQEGLGEWFEGIKAAGAPPKDIQGFAETIVAAKLAHAPEQAAIWLEQNLQEPWVQGGEMVWTTARAFAARDPKGAMEWAQRMGGEDAATAAMSTWCQQDPAAAGNWLGENTGSSAYSPAASVMAIFSMQRNDAAAAKTWADSIPDEAVRSRVLKQLEARGAKGNTGG